MDSNPQFQFDFWIGDWRVTWGDGQEGRNSVRKILDGRVIEENFDGNPSLSFRGRSLSVYNARLALWQQTWVDTEGNYWAFTGRWADGRMTLTTSDVRQGQPVDLRMVFYNIKPDQLDWRWESSSDGGVTWELRWQLHYTRLA